MRGAVLLVAAAAMGCGPEPCAPDEARLADGTCAPKATTAAATDNAGLVALDGARLARRRSLDLRGVPPTLAELDALDAGDETLESLTAAWLDDPRFAERLVFLLHEAWHTRVDELLIHHFEFPTLASDDTREYAYERAVGEEPLRLMAEVAAQDLPWTETLTADWTMAPPLLTALWPVEQDSAGEGWRRAHYTDSRPPAGILATNGLWWRYYTTTANYNRARAALLSRLLVCDDVLSRPVTFSEASGAADVDAAVRENPDCVGCHATIDPTAAALFGFYSTEPHTSVDNARYHPERALDGAEALGVEPAWYGQPVEGLGGLARTIAQDPRFVSCTTETLAGLLWRGPTSPWPEDLARAERAFRSDDLRLKALLTSLVEAPAYTAGAAPGANTPADGPNTVRLLSPDQLAGSVAALTGWTWEEDGAALLDSDTTGYRLLLGGVDGLSVAEPGRLPRLTRAAVVREVAWAGGSTLAARALSGESTLLGDISSETRPGDAGFGAALRALCRAAFGEPADDDTLASLTALWQDAHAAADPQTAWAAVTAAVLRDPRFLTL